MRTEYLPCFGINASKGDYQFKLTTDDLYAMFLGKPAAKVATRRGAVRGVDQADLAKTGWGAVFPEGVDRRIREAVQELLSHRMAAATSQNERLYRELTYRTSSQENKLGFLMRYGAGPDRVDPEKLPYYLLLVGDPEEIPFSFQYQLGVRHAVGRICFETPEQYAQYAHSVVLAETRARPRPRQAALFGVHNHNDWITGICLDHLVKPLASKLAGAFDGWQLSSHLERHATKDQLSRLLGGSETPALLLTSGHSVCFDRNDQRMLDHQGALVCDDWPGPQAEPDYISEQHYFSAENLSADADLLGMVSFHLACFSAGTPMIEYFGHGKRARPKLLAQRPFVAKLPQRLLSHSRGGALAVIGHVDTAWEHSFTWHGAGAQAATYEATFRDLMNGRPVGWAMRHFASRYAELASLISELEIERRETGQAPDKELLVRLWTAHNDARSFIILGDPAVRLSTESSR